MLAMQMMLVRGYSEVPATHMVFVRGYKDVCTIDAAGGCAGVQRQTVLATQRVCISYEEMRGAENTYVL